MARLAFCDYHNMIAILETSEHNVDFHQIVDFIEASHIRYALTINPTVYVLHIRQFWSTARIEATNKGAKILASVDGKPRTIFESSIRRNLKLNDEEGISSLPDAELFENLTRMGYNILRNQKFTFQKGFNEFSSNIATAVLCLATNRVYNFSKMIFDGMVRNVNNKGSKFLMYPSLSFSGQTVPLFDSMMVTQGEGSGTPTEPHHTPSPKAQQSPHPDLLSSLHLIVTSETIPTVTPQQSPHLGNTPEELHGLLSPRLFPLLQMRLHLEISSLKARIKLLKDKDKGTAELSGDDALNKGRNLETGEEAGVERSTKRGSNDTEELVNVLTFLDAANILLSVLYLPLLVWLHHTQDIK
nr:synaptobrevin, longin-like domain protein [Tanacetum cinerariifolium]